MNKIQQFRHPPQIKKQQRINNKLEVTEEETLNYAHLKNQSKPHMRSENYQEKYQKLENDFVKYEQSENFIKVQGQQIQQNQSEDSQSLFKAQQSQQQEQQNFSYMSNQLRKNKSIKKGKNKKVKRSAHHNLQKHTVVTIKSMIKFLPDNQKSDSSIIAQKIWSNFLTTRRKNKGILNILFGVKGGNAIQLQKLLSQYNFKQLLTYSYDEINDAQQILRQMVINQITSQKLSQNLKKRRIANKEQFMEYMMSFVEQLKEGALRRRILAEASSKITQLAQVDKYLSFVGLKR